MSAATTIRASFLALLACFVFLVPARAQTPLQTNQSYVEDVTRPASLNIGDLMSVFGYVMSQLPERVKVYPTENYYYVGFFHNGIRYAGNIRLDASNRDDGKVIFAYFEDTSQWYDGAPDKHAILDAAQGVTVEKVELRRCAGRQYPLHDWPLHALSGADRSRSHRRLRTEEAEAAGLLSLLCRRRRIRCYGASQAEEGCAAKVDGLD